MRLGAVTVDGTWAMAQVTHGYFWVVGTVSSGVILTKYMYLIIYLTTMIKPCYEQALIGMGWIVLVN
jgi:hypothetical protein